MVVANGKHHSGGTLYFWILIMIIMLIYQLVKRTRWWICRSNFFHTTADPNANAEHAFWFYVYNPNSAVGGEKGDDGADGPTGPTGPRGPGGDNIDFSNLNAISTGQSQNS